MSTYGNWYADGLVHTVVDDRDDHREFVTKCGLIEPYIHPKHHGGYDETIITCFQCMTLEYPIDPRDRYEWPRQIMGVWAPAETKEKR